MKRCAFLTLDKKGDYCIDDEQAVRPLTAFGWQVSTLSWRQTAVPWTDFDAVIIRSTWDYWNDVAAFLKVLERIDRETRLANPLELVRWNLEKTYLRDLQARAVRIVPTIWPKSIRAERWVDFFDRMQSDELVIKPVIGANGEDACRVSRTDPLERLEQIETLFRGRAAMVQRFMPHILDEGEYSLFYFNGNLSHAILKVPVDAEFRSQEEHGAEILSVEPEQHLLEAGEQAVVALPGAPLYARIDFVRNDAGKFALMELELIEPSMYLRTNEAASATFARAIDSWFSRH
jgi:glutathione synthase/RimK-type ligase-like ATP-grasp enzyme